MVYSGLFAQIIKGTQKQEYKNIPDSWHDFNDLHVINNIKNLHITPSEPAGTQEASAGSDDPAGVRGQGRGCGQGGRGCRERAAETDGRV